MKTKIIILISIVLAIILSGIIVGGIALTGQAVGVNSEFDYTWTTAICDGNNCRDFNVTCLDGEAIRIDPISGMVIFPDDWEDGRKDLGLCPD